MPVKSLVVHVIDGLGPGGAEQLLTVYAPHLRSLGKNIRIIVLQDKEGNPQSAPLITAGIPVELVAVDKLTNISQIIKLFARLRALQPALIHAHSNFASLLCSLGKLWHCAPVVTTLHTDTLVQPTSASRDEFRRWVGQTTTACLADRVIVLSESADKKMRQRFPRVATEVIPNGIDVQQFARATGPRRETLRRSLGWAEDEFVVLSVAVLRRPKGIDKLVDAFGQFAPSAPGARLFVVGDGEEREALKARARSLGIEAAVGFMGFRRDVPALMAAADVFVLPTLDDAQPTVILEAMASELPVIASRVGGIPCMIEDGVNGLLTPPGDIDALEVALRRLRRESELLARLGAVARRSVERKFSIDGQAAKINSLYDRLITERPRRPALALPSKTGEHGGAL